MKLLKDSKVIYFYLILTKICLLITFQAISTASFSQENEMGVPFAQNFPPKSYGYESQNYSITEDSEGILYVGNLSGILEYDGNSWRLIPQNGIPCLAADINSKIYIGSYNNFGYLSRNKQNINEFISLLNKLPPKNRNIGQISKIVTQNKNVFFVAGSRLYLWDEVNLKMIDSSSVEINIFKINNQIFVSRQPGGIFKFVESKMLKIAGSEAFSNQSIIGILPFNKDLLIKTTEKGFKVLSTTGIVKPFITDVDSFMNLNSYTCAIPVYDGFYAIGTERGGFVVIDKNGKYITGLNEKNGLYNDFVHDMYLDRHNNLWLSLNNGICRTEVPSAFTYFNRNTGVHGSISAICRYKGRIFIATSQGTFYLKTHLDDNFNKINFASEKFIPIKNLTSDCNRFFIMEEGLLVSAADGIYLIKTDEAIKISEGQLEAIVRSKKHPNIIYLGKSNGLSALSFKNGKWVDLGRLTKLNEQVRTISEENDGTLWLGTDYYGTFKVDLTKGWSNTASFVSYKERHGLPKNYNWLDVYSSSMGTLFSTQKGLYRFNKEKNEFYIDTLIGFNFKNGNRWVFPISEDSNKNLWLSTGTEGVYAKETALAYYNGQGRKYTLVTVPFKKIKDFTIESIFTDLNNVVWFGSFDGLIRFDTKYYNNDTSALQTMLRKIIIGYDSIVYCGVYTRLTDGKIDTIIPKFNYRYNHIVFNFSAPFYESPEDVYFQYFLENFDKDWSPWEKNHIKEYTNLSEGEYIFHVRAKNIYNNISKEASYHYIIKPPLWRTWYAMIIYIILLASFIIMLLKWRAYLYAQEKFKLEHLLAERTEELVKQKERAEELIANILPKDTAEELASKGHATRKKYKMVTVLFSDVQGFTMIAEHMNPEKLLDELDKFFLQFDIVVEKLNIEKIKTIGDAYMCAGGIPQKNRTNPIDVVMSAIEMQQFMKILRVESENEWDIRIGVHTGPVIAGVVGSKKFSYDIWGDTVNIASRMESSGKAGEINISEITYDLVKDYFDCDYRGKLPVKYKGEIDMYFVRGIKPELSVNGEGITPNEKFFKKMQFIRFDDLEEIIMTKLDLGLPKDLYYHNLKHTIDVIVQVEIFGLGEGITRDEMLLLKTAALFHDTGFLIGYDDHELLSIKMAKDILPHHHYSEQQIQTISEMIFATKFPPSPRTKLEKILCDADLDYLGRADFIPVSQNLFRELYERGKIRSIDEWNKLQYEFIRNHQYFTETAKTMRNINKNLQLDDLNTNI
jgi:class 3 adenylate cyclase/ligand-binding sensor domain-containing protein/HD superfamily phosphodiesterase